MIKSLLTSFRGSKSLCSLDKAGVACSGVCALQSLLAGACAIHCMLTPIVAFSAPSFSSYFENIWLHFALLLLLLPIAVVAFSKGKKIHGYSRPIILGGTGIFLFALVFVLEFVFKVGNEKVEVVLKVLASTLLIAAHLYNMKYLKKAKTLT